MPVIKYYMPFSYKNHIGKMVETKTLVYAGVGIVAVLAVVGVVVAVHSNQNKPGDLLAKAKKAVQGRIDAMQQRPVAIDYDATASMWEDEDRIYRAAARLDGGYFA
mgnify:CR=1 FL=1